MVFVPCVIEIQICSCLLEVEVNRGEIGKLRKRREKNPYFLRAKRAHCWHLLGSSRAISQPWQVGS